MVGCGWMIGLVMRATQGKRGSFGELSISARAGNRAGLAWQQLTSQRKVTLRGALNPNPGNRERRCQIADWPSLCLTARASPRLLHNDLAL